MVDLGLTPMQAIQAGTVRAAELMRLDDALGSVQAGKLADLVIVDFDPLTDIHRLADPGEVSVVVQGGAPVKDNKGWLGLALRQSSLG